jgi:hypothetical protein
MHATGPQTSATISPTPASGPRTCVTGRPTNATGRPTSATVTALPTSVTGPPRRAIGPPRTPSSLGAERMREVHMSAASERRHRPTTLMTANVVSKRQAAAEPRSPKLRQRVEGGWLGRSIAAGHDGPAGPCLVSGGHLPGLSVRVAVVVGRRSRSANGPRPHRWTNSAPCRSRLLAGES